MYIYVCLYMYMHQLVIHDRAHAGYMWHQVSDGTPMPQAFLEQILSAIDIMLEQQRPPRAAALCLCQRHRSSHASQLRDQRVINA